MKQNIMNEEKFISSQQLQRDCWLLPDSMND